MKTKLSYYISHPIQYFSPLFAGLAREFEFQVFYFSDSSVKGSIDVGFGKNVKWDTPLLEGYQYTFIRNYSWRRSVSNRLADLINPGVITHLYKDQSKIIVVNGWSYFSVLLTIVVAKLLGKKVWLRAENPLNQELRKSRPVRIAKQILLGFGLFRMVDKLLYIGVESRRFFEYYSVREDKLLYTPYSVDNQRFQELYEKTDKAAAVKKMGVPEDKKVVLFVGKYISKKRPLDLLRAFSSLDRNDLCLVMVGDGPLRSDMELFIREEGLQEKVILTGFVNQSVISDYYSIADIFVMCSGMGETWGLSVNEAMNFCLPIVITDSCGCAADLVEHGKNGYVVREGDTVGLADAITALADDDTLRERCGNTSMKMISNFSIPIIIENIRSGVIGVDAKTKADSF